MAPKILQQAHLEQQQPHVKSALSQVHVADVEGERSFKVAKGMCIAGSYS